MTPRLWPRALLWLAFLAPFFFLTYNFANHFTSQRPSVPSLAFTWEFNLPFLAWTILPYWSSDLLYAGSLMLCRNREELDRHARRLLAIQCFSVACFLLFPLRCLYLKPALSGWTSNLFDSLLSFDQPFNQAPSLHLSLAVILWPVYRARTSGLLRTFTAAWFILIGIAAWTTYQHHFIDLPTGIWAGILVLAALPTNTYPNAFRPRLTVLYLLAAILFTFGAFYIEGLAWLLLWPAFSLSLVASAYWTGDPAWLGKRNGRLPFWIWPYVAFAWLNSRIWTRSQTPNNPLSNGVWIGRAPNAKERQSFPSLIDLTAELPLTSNACIPILDLTPPSFSQLDAAVAAIEQTANERPTLVCCALGYSRSALAAAAWLIASGQARSSVEALAAVRRTRPQVVIGASLTHRLQQWAEYRNGPSI